MAVAERKAEIGRVRRVAIAGGIGAGKSVVSAVLRAMGWPVYDCDSRAKELMDSDPAIIRLIAEQIDAGCITPDGRLDRNRLSACVFASADALMRLNNIVHRVVREDLECWFNRQKAPILFVETAIPYSSGLCRMVDMIWQVEAPESLRIERVMRRSGLSADDIKARIASQKRTENPEKGESVSVETILNDNIQPVLPQIEKLIEGLGGWRNQSR